MEKKLYDRRTMTRYVEKGILKPAEVQSFMKGLPDETANAQWVEMDLKEAEITEGADSADDSSEAT